MTGRRNHGKGLDKGLRADAKLTLRVDSKRTAIKNEFVLSACLININNRQLV